MPSTIRPLPARLRVPDLDRGRRLTGAARPKTRPRRTGSLPRRMHQFFERACDRTPDALALVAGSQQLTYAALDARANQLAHYLISAHGIQPGCRVGILLERSVHTYVALLAVLKCGAGFVPLDASYPADRIAFMAEDANTALIVTTSE